MQPPQDRPRSRRPRALVALVAVVATSLISAACGDRSGKTLADPSVPPPDTTTTTTLPIEVLPAEPEAADESAPMFLVAAWVDGSLIPDRHTCRDRGVPPALSWSNVPLGTVELALTVTDLDNDGYAHWIVYGIPPSATGSNEGAPPGGSFEWVNSSGVIGWEPPCPPPDETHRYLFTVHALNQQLEVADDALAREVISILDATTIGRASTSGRVEGT